MPPSRVFGGKCLDLRPVGQTSYSCRTHPGAIMAIRAVWIALFALLTCGGTFAATPDDILIGVEAPSSLSPSGAAENLGMRLVMQAVNDEGGINGRKLVAKSYARSESGAAGDAQVLASVARLDEQDHVLLLWSGYWKPATEIGG